MTHSPTGRIRLTHPGQRRRILCDDEVLADTTTAIELHEIGYPARVYIPRVDVASDRLAVSQTRTHCPFKGDATYYHVRINGQTLSDAAWSYEQPIEAMTAIGGYLAFDHPQLALDDATL